MLLSDTNTLLTKQNQLHIALSDSILDTLQILVDLMPPHSGNRSRLFTTCWFLLRRILYAHHHRLTRSVSPHFFLCAAFCVVADAVACSSRLKCARLKLNQKVHCAVCYWVCFVSSVFVSDSSIRTIQLCAVLKTIFDS